MWRDQIELLDSAHALNSRQLAYCLVADLNLVQSLSDEQLLAFASLHKDAYAIAHSEEEFSEEQLKS